jgi:hypothetical protein
LGAAALVDQKRDHPCAEEVLQGLETAPGHDVEDERANRRSATSAYRVGVEVQILADGVNGHDDAGDVFGQAHARAQKLDQALVGDAEQSLSKSRS